MPYANLSYEWLGPAIFVSGGGAFLLLYLQDRNQLPALRLAGAYLMSLVGFVTIMLVDTDRQPAFQFVIHLSLFAGHFLLLWGVASLFRKPVPWGPFMLASILVVAAVVYANQQGSMFWLRVVAVSGFASIIYLTCGMIAWRAKSHPVDLVLVWVFLIQAFLATSRIVRVEFSELDLSTHSAFKDSPFAASMQTENAIFAIMIGLALFARYSVTMVMQLQRLAETDPLTGLFNRRAFESKAQALRAATAPLPAGLIICDIDYFKSVNDCHGHEVGDRTLKAFARLLQRETPETALCARFGGEEFCILVPGLDDEATRLLAIHLRGAVEGLRIGTGTGTLKLTASFGCCQLGPSDDLWTALAAADTAVYQAKNDGRNLVRSARPNLAEPGRTEVA